MSAKKDKLFKDPNVRVAPNRHPHFKIFTSQKAANFSNGLTLSILISKKDNPHISKL